MNMNRRDYVKTLGAVSLALPSAAPAADTGKGRFRPAICAYSFRPQFEAKTMTYEKLIHMASDLNVDIDFTVYWLPDTTDQTLIPLKQLAYRSGVALYSLSIASSMTQPTPELRAKSIEGLKRWLDVAERLGASHVRAYGGGTPKGMSQEQAIANAVETVKLAGDEAGRRGITLSVEDDGGITANADTTIEIVRKAKSPWVGINVDVGNFPDNAYAQIEMCAPYAVHCHYKTMVRVGGQRQPVDLPRVMKILGDAGYRGHLALEYKGTGDDAFALVPETILKMRAAMCST
jgi:L-ribulose-5-phosphate 3-epimerase